MLLNQQHFQDLHVLSTVMDRNLALYRFSFKARFEEETWAWQLCWSRDKLPIGLGYAGLEDFHPEHVVTCSPLSVKIQGAASDLTALRFKFHGECLAVLAVLHICSSVIKVS